MSDLRIEKVADGWWKIFLVDVLVVDIDSRGSSQYPVHLFNEELSADEARDLAIILDRYARTGNPEQETARQDMSLVGRLRKGLLRNDQEEIMGS